MAFKFNGTDLKNIIYNGVSLGKVIFNGVTVWTKELFVFKEGNTSLSNGCTIRNYDVVGNSYYEFLNGTFNVVANGSAGSKCIIRVTIFDITDFDKLEFVAKCNDTNLQTYAIDIYDSTEKNLLYAVNANDPVTTSYKTFTVDVSKYTGKLVLHLNATTWSSGAWRIFYFKSIRAY